MRYAHTQGENWELRQQLNSEYREKRADAIKRVIANHTIGKDCSGLFPDVVKNMVSATHGSQLTVANRRP